MIWMYESVMTVFKPDPTNTYPQCIHKLLFLFVSEEQWRQDGWPAEQERPLFFKATSEVPLLQDTLIHLLAIGMSKVHPLNGRDTIDLAESMVKRAAGLHHLVSEDFAVLSMDKVNDVMECLFQLTAYTYPDTITLPSDYTPPSMAIASAYWKVSPFFWKLQSNGFLQKSAVISSRKKNTRENYILLFMWKKTLKKS